MSGIISAGTLSLPMDIDAVVNVSKPQSVAATDYSTLVFATPGATFDQDADRIRLYDSLDAVLDDVSASSEAYKAASAFFNQSPRPEKMAIGRIFQTPVAGFLQCGQTQQTMANWKAITTGSFALAIDGTSANVTGINLSSASGLAGIAAALQVKVRAANAAPGFTGATVVYKTNETIRITSGTTGDSSSVSVLSAVSPAVGVDISGANFLNGALIADSSVQNAYVVSGYVPGTIDSELALISEAALTQNLFIYGWTLDAVFRDVQAAETAMAWAEGQSAAMMGIVTNSPMAYDPTSISDVGALAFAAGYRRSFVVYHNNAYFYPEVAILAELLSVDYAGVNTTITAKFKDLYGIPTVPMLTTELNALEAKRINTFTLVGNGARTFREGQEANISWFMDDLVNLDNLKKDLQTAIFNVFLVNKKVPYNVNGVTLLTNAMNGILSQYVTNGTLSTRPITAQEANGGVLIAPAYSIAFADLATISVADRAARIGPPATVTANLAGAIHSVTINVNAYA